MTVGEQIKETIDYMEKGQIEHALTHVCIAIDVTSQKVSKRSKSSPDDYKKFISDNMWLISYLGLGHIMANSIRVQFQHPDVKSDASGTCTLEDIVYHVLRCSLIHSTGPGKKIIWSNNVILGSDQGNLIIRNTFIWGLVATVIFNPVNKDEKIDESYWFQIDDFKFFISEVWGRVDLAIRVIKMNSDMPTPSTGTSTPAIT